MCGTSGPLIAELGQGLPAHLSQLATMTGRDPASNSEWSRPRRPAAEETCVSITRSPDTSRSGPGAGSGRGRPRGGLRLAGIAVRLTLGAQLFAMLTVLIGAFIL